MTAAGRVVLLVGPSCAGKSALAKAIQEAAAEHYLVLSLDSLFAATAERWGGSGAETAAGFHYIRDGEILKIGCGPVGRRLLHGFHRAVAAYARAGVDVVVDDMLLDEECLADWREALAGLETRLVLLLPPLDELRRREALRQRRSTPGLAAGHYGLHAGLTADLVLDTAVLTPEAAAALVLG
jgi:chloramphenicol 3-O phosphotransferase